MAEVKQPEVHVQINLLLNSSGTSV